jgi:hypothetical protein
MRAFFILGLQCFFTAVIAAAVQSSAVGDDPPPQATVQNPPAATPGPMVTSPSFVVCCPAITCYPMCPPCPVIPYYIVCTPVPCAVAQSPPQSCAKPTPTPPKAEEPATPKAGCEKPAASTPGPSPPPLLNPTQIGYEVQSLIARLGVEFNYTPLRTGFKCELMQVKPQPAEDVFGKQGWQPAGQPVELTQTNWKGVTDAILKALNGVPPSTGAWHSPVVGLRVEIPAAGPSSPAVQYVILMFFDSNLMYLYRNGTLIGAHAIQDNDNWAARLSSLGAAPTPTSTSP